MLFLLIKKSFCTSVYRDGMKKLVTICETGDFRLLSYHNISEYWMRICLGFFPANEADIRRMNKSQINGMYQKDSLVKFKEFKWSVIKSKWKLCNNKIVQILLKSMKDNLILSFKDLIDCCQDDGKDVILCDIASESIGKGFQGSMKLFGYAGLPASHGVSLKHRAAGSVGARKPNSVWKGKPMPRRMGGDMIYVKKLKILKNIKIKHAIAILGSIPGSTSKNKIIRMKIAI